MTPYAQAVLLGFAAFFAVLLLGFANPFQPRSPVPAEGTGLNPLLRHPMMIHPVMLYSGYTLAAVPFAFAIGALAARRLGADWIAAIRRFSLAAWLCLGIGILLGARWSYVELGWGGYWGWDPVENASLMPWLTGTAFLHSIMIQEKRGMLKVWNVSLVLATGTLAVLGTFLVRSGVLDSIHAFVGEGNGIAWMFTGLIAVMVAGSIALVYSRRASLRSDHRLDSLWSREAVFLLNNLVLVALCFVVFWGTFFPLISEAITGTKASVGPPWFSRYTVPLAIVLVLLAGIGPVIAWRRATPANLRRNFARARGRRPGRALALLVLTDAARKPLALAMFCFAAFVLAAVGQELFRGARARRAMTRESPPSAVVALVRRNRRRYGGYLVHAGMAVLFVGVAASSAFQHARDFRLSPGQTARIGGYAITYVKPTAKLASEKVSLGRRPAGAQGRARPRDAAADARLLPDARARQGTGGRDLRRPGHQRGRPARRAAPRPVDRDRARHRAAAAVHLGGRSPLRQRRSRRAGRVVAALAQRYVQHPPPAMFRIIDSPLVTWIWIGSFIAFGGGLIALWPAPAVRVAARPRPRARAPRASPRGVAFGRPWTSWRSSSWSRCSAPPCGSSPRRCGGSPRTRLPSTRPRRRGRAARGGTRRQVPRDPRRRDGPRTGKLSEEDHRALDATLRAEAVEILRELDAARDQAAGSGQTTS